MVEANRDASLLIQGAWKPLEDPGAQKSRNSHLHPLDLFQGVKEDIKKASEAAQEGNRSDFEFFKHRAVDSLAAVEALDIEELRDEAFKLQRTLASDVHFSTTSKVVSHEIDASIRVHLDQEMGDSNGAIRLDMSLCLKEGEVFIAPRSLFQSFDERAPNQGVQEFNEVLKKEGASWSFYEDPTTPGFIVAIPHKLKIKGLDDCFRKLGLNDSRKLKPVLRHELLDSPMPELEAHEYLERLRSLFNPSSNSTKVFSIVGHGLLGTEIASLKLAQFKNLLEMFEDLNCQALQITSCYSGGINTRAILENPPSFPVIIPCLGDNSATIHGLNREEIRISQAWRKKPPKNWEEAKALWAKVRDGNEIERFLNNGVKVLYPGNRRFRPLLEIQEIGHVDTQMCRELDLEACDSSIVLKDLEVLYLTPVRVDHTIEVEGEFPFLQSTIPGPATHRIRKMQIKNKQGEEALCSLRGAFEKRIGEDVRSKFPVQNKAFLIDRLETEDKVYKDICVYYGPDGIRLLLGGSDKELRTSQGSRVISDYEYLTFRQSFLRKTQSPSQVTQEATAGYQPEEDLRECFSVPENLKRQHKEIKVICTQDVSEAQNIRGKDSFLRLINYLSFEEEKKAWEYFQVMDLEEDLLNSPKILVEVLSLAFSLEGRVFFDQLVRKCGHDLLRWDITDGFLRSVALRSPTVRQLLSNNNAEVESYEQKFLKEGGFSSEEKDQLHNLLRKISFVKVLESSVSLEFKKYILSLLPNCPKPGYEVSLDFTLFSEASEWEVYSELLNKGYLLNAEQTQILLDALFAEKAEEGVLEFMLELSEKLCVQNPYLPITFSKEIPWCYSVS